MKDVVLGKTSGIFKKTRTRKKKWREREEKVTEKTASLIIKEEKKVVALYFNHGKSIA